jgi:NAD(P)-dependent dehydrogenase (short-subunit alcohol dehydrogenase family)
MNQINGSMPMQGFDLGGRVALVTGGSKGIGRAIAQAFVTAGGSVAIAARDADQVRTTSDELGAGKGRVLAIVGDVAEDGDLERMVAETTAHFGGIDILVNNAATGDRRERALVDYTRGGVDRVLKVNVWAPIRLMQLCRPIMARRGGGVIVNIASNAGNQAAAGLGIYSPSKAAVMNLSDTIGAELASDGIRCVSVSPGIIRTELASRIVKAVEDGGLTPNPLGRVGEPEEVAALVLYLASPAGSFATATNYVIDGGELKKGPLRSSQSANRASEK